MYREILLEAINENVFDEWYEDNKEIEYARGAYLYTAITIIEQIQTYFYETINDALDNAKQISKDDVFLFLKIKNIFEDDYSNLYNEIDSELGEADYGCYYFEDASKFEIFKEKIEKLYDEFKNLE